MDGEREDPAIQVSVEDTEDGQVVRATLTLEPGPANRQLAEAIVAYFEGRPTPGEE